MKRAHQIQKSLSRLVPTLTALSLAGCHGLSCSGQSGGGTPKDTIVVGWESEVRTFDPRYASDANSQYLENLIHCSLVGFDPNGAVTPQLAAEFPEWKSSTEMDIKIRPDIHFSDGTVVTANDVKATYDYFLNPDATPPSPRSGAFVKVKGIEVLDPQTVRFTLTEPDASFITNLVVGILPVRLAQMNQIQEEKDVVGCGPYTLASADLNTLMLTSNQHFNLAAPAKTQKIEIKVIKDEKTRFAKLRKGEIDLVQNSLNRDVLKDIGLKYPSLEVQKRPGLKMTYIGFNMKDSLAGNPAIRQAIAHAVDRKEIIDYVLSGLATPASSILTPGDPFLKDDLTVYPQDIAKAQQILESAGFKPGEDGIRLSLSYKTTTDVTRINIAKALASQLRKVGIQLNVEAMEWGRFKDDVDNGRIQLWGLTWIGFKDPDIYRYAFATESMPPNGGNRGWYSNKELDKLLAEGRTTNNIEQRKAVYAAVQDIIARELPYICLWHEENFVVHQKDLKDFTLYADGRFSALARAYK